MRQAATLDAFQLAVSYRSCAAGTEPAHHLPTRSRPMSARTTRIVYWTFTVLFLVPQVWSATQMLSRAPRMTETITDLGYPLYVMTILGIAKLLGAGAILFFDRWPSLKEWAYAGFTFDVIGAFVSHLAH